MAASRRAREVPARSVNVMYRVEDIELARRSDNVRPLDHMLQLPRAVVDNDDGRLLFLAAPDREPHFIASLVVFRLYHTLRTFTQLGPFGDWQNVVTCIQVVDCENCNALADGFVGIERRVDPQVIRLGVRFYEQRTAALALQDAHHLPCVLRVARWIRSQERDIRVAEGAGDPGRTMVWIVYVCAASGVRDLLHVDQRRQRAIPGIDDRDLV